MSETPIKRNTQYIEPEGDDHGEELWIVSYADMVTLLFGFFVILYSFSTLDDKKFDQMTEKVAEAFKSKDERKTSESQGGVSDEMRQIRALQMLVSMLNLGDNVKEAIPKIEKSFAEGKENMNAKALIEEKVAKSNKQLVGSVEKSENEEYQIVELMLPASTLFPSGGYQLSKVATASLQRLAQDLHHVSGLDEIEIVGHTDGQPPAPNPIYDSNFVLSALRAGAVASALVRYGIDEKRVAVRGMGNLKPLVPEFNTNGKPNLANMAKNRRVGVILKVRRSHATAH